MRIKHNISALNAQIALKINESKMTKNLEKLTSGYRINRSGDDAAGLAISEQMRSQINGLTQAEHNARDGVNLLKTGEGAMQEIHAMLIKLNGLAVQSANGVYTDEGHRQLMQAEADRISEEIDRIAEATRFNYVKLFQDDGPEAKTVVVTAALPGGKTTKNAAAKNFATANLPGLPNDTDTNDIPKDLIYTKTKVAYDQSQMTAVGSGNEKIQKKAAEETMPLPGRSKKSDSADVQATVAFPGGTDFQTAPVPQTGTDPQPAAAFQTKSTSQAGKASKPVVDNPIVFQVGANKEYKISIPRFYLSSAALGLDAFDISSQEEAQISIDRVGSMIDRVSEIRGAYGAAENALEHAINSINIQKENMTAAESRIRDTDMASELTERTKHNILVQTSQSMLAQANALPETTLQLLQ